MCNDFWEFRKIEEPSGPRLNVGFGWVLVYTIALLLLGRV